MSLEINIASYLEKMPKKTLFNVGGRKNGRVLSTSAAIKDIKEKYTDHSYVKNIFNSLSKIEKNVFFIISWNSYGISSSEILEKLKLKKELEKNIEDLDKILKNFVNILFVFAKESKEVNYFIFPEILDILRSELELFVCENFKLKKEIQTEGAVECSYSFYYDILLLLINIDKNKAEKTKNGMFRKKVLDDFYTLLMSLKILPKELIKDNQTLFTTVINPIVLANVLKIDKKSLFASDGMDYTISAGAGAIYELFARYFRNSISGNVISLLTFLKTSNSSFDTKELKESICFLDKNDNFDSSILLLFFTGFISYNKGLISITNLGISFLENKTPTLQESNNITIMPNFEIMLPRIASGNEFKKLLQYAEIVKSDTLITLVLTKESVFKGFSKGESLNEFDEGFSFPDELTNMSSTPIPQNVIFTLREWYRLFFDMKFEELVVLRIGRKDLMEQIGQMFFKEGLLKEKIENFGYVVSKKNYDKLYSKLQDMAFNPRPLIKNKLINTLLEKDKKIISISEEFSTISFPKETFGELLFPEEIRIQEANISAPTGKYGTKYQKLSFIELVHVINYAILMESTIDLEFKNTNCKEMLHPLGVIHDKDDPFLNFLNKEGLEEKINMREIEKIRVAG